MFLPGSNDPVQLDLAMRFSLAESLDYVMTVVGGHLNLPASDVQATLESIRSHRVVPGVFGRYYKLVLAVERGDLPEARRLFLQIAQLAQQPPGFSVAPYTEAALGDERALFGDLVDPNPGASPWLCPPRFAEDFDQRVRESLDLIGAADPALADELCGLLIQVVGASPSQGPDARPFGSVSSFMLWGLAILNVERYPTAADLTQGLVHEAAHLLLFAKSIEEPLVTNAIEERYHSPLRPDPRPMDGVFHATFVAARMHYAAQKLRDATTSDFAPVPLEQLDQKLSGLRGLYFGGLRTIQDHGQLTGTGRRIIEESLDYMNAA